MVSHHVFLVKITERNPVNAAQNLPGFNKTGGASDGKVNLCYISCNNRF